MNTESMVVDSLRAGIAPALGLAAYTLEELPEAQVSPEMIVGDAIDSMREHIEPETETEEPDMTVVTFDAVDVQRALDKEPEETTAPDEVEQDSNENQSPVDDENPNDLDHDGVIDNVDMCGVDRDTVISSAVEAFIEKHKPRLPDLIMGTRAARDYRAALLTEINEDIKVVNRARDKGDGFATLKYLPGHVVAEILIATGDVRMMITGSTGYVIVSKHFYADETGKLQWSGTYAIHNPNSAASPLLKAMHTLAPSSNRHDRETMEQGLTMAPQCSAAANNKLVFFRNGVWDYMRNKFTAFTDPAFDDHYGNNVALMKLPVCHPYGPGAKLKPDENGKIREPVIHNDRDGTDWCPSQTITDPFELETPEGQASVLIIWQAMQFMIRKMNGLPHVYHFWIDVTGNGHNGKGTIWDMMHRLIEDPTVSDAPDMRSTGDRVIALSADDLNRDYVLGESIMTAYAIVGEESNGAVTYIKNCSTFKMLSRAQEITVRAIRQRPFKFAFQGLLLQQSNKAPQFEEKNNSAFSHVLVTAFSKSFSDARPYIKDDYVTREEVAEWLAYRLTVEMKCLERYDEKAMEILEPNKKEMMSASMNTFQFLDEVLPGLCMNFIPVEFLYDLYIRWCDTSNVPPNRVMDKKIFRDDMLQYATNNPEIVSYTKKTCRSSFKVLDVKHPALAQYGSSARHGLSKFVHAKARDYNNYSLFCTKLDPREWCDRSGTSGRLWNQGGFVRVIKWTDPRAKMITGMMQNEEIAYDEDNDVNVVTKEVNRAAREM